jgi:hypothetical protein
MATSSSQTPASTDTSAADASTSVDEQAAAGTPEASGQQEPGSMPTAEATAAGSADPGPASGLSLSDRGVVSLPAAPMPQFEMVRTQGFGAEPVYPDGLEDLLERGGGGEAVSAAQQELDVNPTNPAIIEALQSDDAQQNAIPTQAGSSADSSVIASGEGSDTSNPQTGTPPASTTSGTGTTGTGTAPADSSTSGSSTSGTSTSGSSSSSSS